MDHPCPLYEKDSQPEVLLKAIENKFGNEPKAEVLEKKKSMMAKELRVG